MRIEELILDGFKSYRKLADKTPRDRPANAEGCENIANS
jgi:hypothetical protein